MWVIKTLKWFSFNCCSEHLKGFELLIFPHNPACLPHYSTEIFRTICYFLCLLLEDLGIIKQFLVTTRHTCRNRHDTKFRYEQRFKPLENITRDFLLLHLKMFKCLRMISRNNQFNWLIYFRYFENQKAFKKWSLPVIRVVYTTSWFHLFQATPKSSDWYVWGHYPAWNNAL